MWLKQIGRLQPKGPGVPAGLIQPDLNMAAVKNIDLVGVVLGEIVCKVDPGTDPLAWSSLVIDASEATGKINLSR